MTAAVAMPGSLVMAFCADTGLWAEKEVNHQSTYIQEALDEAVRFPEQVILFACDPLRTSTYCTFAY